MLSKMKANKNSIITTPWNCVGEVVFFSSLQLHFETLSLCRRSEPFIVILFKSVLGTQRDSIVKGFFVNIICIWRFRLRRFFSPSLRCNKQNLTPSNFLCKFTSASVSSAKCSIQTQLAEHCQKEKPRTGIDKESDK